MSQIFQGWAAVATNLRKLAESGAIELNHGQKWSLRAIADRIQTNGIVLADEVGMGKTRIACALAKSVVDAGGRVAVLVPPGLGYQWREELRAGDICAPQILRSLLQFLKTWETVAEPMPWFEQSTVIISHAFTNWRLGENSDSRRWALLPEVYANWRKATDNRFPRSYRDNDLLANECVRNAAQSIVESIAKLGARSQQRTLVDELSREAPWPGMLEAKRYVRGAELRNWLERCVGLGLGVFDLVIVDEAHKSRGDDTGLSRILDGVILQSSNARRLAMTATPVELEIRQWTQTFDRIGVKNGSLDQVISSYAETVRILRQMPSNREAMKNFIRAKNSFESALSPYLLRRDKREDERVLEFVRYTGKRHNAYRRLSEIIVQTDRLTLEWKRSVCAAEALSFVSKNADDSVSKRSRLTIGNGHGISMLIDQFQRREPEDKSQDVADSVGKISSEKVTALAQADKRVQRAAWWRNVLLEAHHGGGSPETALYEHPAILASIVSIEGTVKAGEKVLVFGRFTRPLRALVNLLNARCMLSTLDAGDAWPQQQVHESEWCAIQAAHRQLGRAGEIDKVEVDKLLKARYQTLEDQRKGFRESLIDRLEEGFEATRGKSMFHSLFIAFKAAATASEKQTLATVARALSDHFGGTQADVTANELVQAFSELVAAAGDRDTHHQEGSDEFSESSAASRWQDIEARMREDYSHSQSGFARLMHGETEPATRRLLQLAFNRRHAFPKVLVAQSVVGREGLNLHKSCRTVVLLHPEWNPGVVEQQIGRVDRLGSLWEEMLQQAIEQKVEPSEIPRIEIRPVVFKGTYDESNWQVLNDRWDEFRAQLHGVILSYKEGEDDEVRRLYDEINSLAPHFSPTPKDSCH